MARKDGVTFQVLCCMGSRFRLSTLASLEDTTFVVDAGAPRLRLYMAEDGTLRGLVVGVERWEAAALSSALEAAYGASLPAAWRDAIVQQVRAQLLTRAESQQP